MTTKKFLLLLVIFCTANISAQTTGKEIEKFIKKNLSSITNKHGAGDNVKIIAYSDEIYYLLYATGLHMSPPPGQMYFHVNSESDIKKLIFKGPLFKKDNVDILEDFHKFREKEERKIDPIQKPAKYDSGDWTPFQYGFNFKKIENYCKCCNQTYELYYSKINVK